MKKSMIGLLVFSFVLFSAVGIYALDISSFQVNPDFNCSDYGIQCGSTNIILANGSNLVKSCGVCSSSTYCYEGKCMDPKVLGKFDRPVGFNTNCSSLFQLSDFYAYPGQPMTDRLSQFEKVCMYYGCNYDSQAQKCTGTLSSCSYFRNQSCIASDNENRTSVLDEETGICTSTIKVYWSYEQECVGKLKGVWNSTDFSCTYVSENSLSYAGYIKVDNTSIVLDPTKLGCSYTNEEQYKSEFLIYKNSSLSSDGNVYLDNNDLKSIQDGNNLTITLQMTNSGLPKDTEIVFSIYAAINGIPYDFGMERDFNASQYLTVAQYRTTPDSQGNLNVTLPISEQLLSLMGYKGSGFFKVFLRTPNGISITQGYPFWMNTKTGECTGSSPTCSGFSEEACLEIQHFKLGDCSWNSGTNSCNGNTGVSCASFNTKDTCDFIGCKWKANSIFERFLDWIKGIFGA